VRILYGERECGKYVGVDDDEHGSWVDGHHRTCGRREYHGSQSQFGSGSQRGGHGERPQCVGCAGEGWCR